METLVKNKLFPFLLLILISVVFLIPLISNNFYLSHDGEAHVARFAAYYKVFIDGQVPLRWAGDLNYGYGSPVFIFYYPLPGILSTPLHILGLSFENAFKILIGFFFSLSFITFFLFAREFVRKEVAFLGALLYGLAPYHFLNLYVRGDIAEIIALAIVPLVFMFVKKSIERKSLNFLILASLSYALLILSHNATSLIFSPVILIYAVLLSKNKRDAVFGLTPIILGLVISAFFWTPSLVESRFTHRDIFIGDMFRTHFPSILQLIYSSWGFGPDVNKPGGLSPQIGIINFALSATSISLLLKKFKEKKAVTFWAIVLSIAIFLTLNMSSVIWQNVPFLKLLQFPWRMVGLVSFASVVLALLFLSRVQSKRIIITLSIIVIIYSLSFLKIQAVESKTDTFYLSYKGTTDYHGAASSIWTAGDFASSPESPYEVIEGTGEIEQVRRKSNIHEFSINASTALKVVDNTVYFPGWQAMVDSKRTPIQFQDPNYRGLITFSVPAGEHNVRVIFGESPVRLIADLISLVGIFIIALLFIFRGKPRLDNFVSNGVKRIK